jgi:pyruvate dehydrogenase E2 component (dihydrolipoamide acetyltransferase)
MSIEIKVPDLGDGVDSGDVLEILVREGEMIRKDQGIVELETDKATVEDPQHPRGPRDQDPGRRRPKRRGGRSVDLAGSRRGRQTGGKPESRAVQSRTGSQAGRGEAQAGRGEIQAGSRTQAGAGGRADEADEDGEPAAAQETGRRAGGGQASESRRGVRTRVAAAAAATADEAGEIAAGPAIRRFAREVGVDLRRVKASGEGGRITREDVLEAVRQASQQAAAAAPPAATGPGSPSSDNWGPVRIERMSKIRRTIAAQMHKSWEACPRVTNFDDADVTELERIRVSSKSDYAARGVRLSSLPFVIKSVAMALRNNPVLNASVDIDNGMIVYKDYVNIGIAVDTDRGLVVPVLRHADRMSFPEVARALSAIAENARNNDFSVDDLRGGTFSISNLGAIGGAYSTPIINVPEVAILLVGRSRKMPRVVENDQIAVRLVMPLSLAYDHRLVDGAAAARFLNEVIGYLEAPARLLLAP